VFKGDQPFGALVCLRGQIIAEATNTCTLNCDPTGHAETNLVRSLSSLRLTRDDVAQSIFYASTEPCLMCTGAILHGGFKHLVYGCSQSALSSCISCDRPRDSISSCQELIRRFHPGVCVEGPVLEDVGKRVHADFGWPSFLAGPGCGSWYANKQVQEPGADTTTSGSVSTTDKHLGALEHRGSRGTVAVSEAIGGR